MSDIPVQTLNPVDVHQALAAILTMYAGIISDHNRERALLQMQVATLRAQLKEAQAHTDPRNPLV
jgi:hypothetical protein